tara:strand:- start:43073 stop:43516 length:444 start_codon:yes stop_codon:yes gene_type:complete
MIRVLKAFFPAVLLAYVTASLLATQTVLANLGDMGVVVPLTVRLEASLHDLLGMIAYLLLILLAFVLAMPVAAGLVRAHRVPGPRVFWFALAGFVGVLMLHLIMREVLGIWVIAAAREWPGLLLQCSAGALGGWLFSIMSKAQPAQA